MTTEDDVDRWNSVARAVLLVTFGIIGLILVISVLAIQPASATGGCGGG